MEERDDRPTEAMAAQFLDDATVAEPHDHDATVAQPHPPQVAEDPHDATVAQRPLELEDTDAVPPSEDSHLARGAVIHGYRIDEEIGAGAMGVVYAATHPVIGKRVAIKVLRHELCSEAAAVERFVTEARAVNAIGHPNIIDIFDLGTLGDGRQFMVMDLLEGETLSARIARGAMSTNEATPLIAEIASALAAAHAKGIVHRDLKSDNVFIARVPSRRPEAKLLDFGLAKLVVAAFPSVALQTKTGTVVGTAGYMSPEQARGRASVDHRTDIYALGAVAFEMLTGRLPYIRSNTLDLLIAHAEAPIPSVRDHARDVPEQLAQLVEAMLAKHPKDRPTLDAARIVLKRLAAAFPPITATEMAVIPPPGPRSGPIDGTEPTALATPEDLLDEAPPPPILYEGKRAITPAPIPDDSDDPDASDTHVRPSSDPLAPPAVAPLSPAALLTSSTTEPAPLRTSGLAHSIPPQNSAGIAMHAMPAYVSIAPRPAAQPQQPPPAAAAVTTATAPARRWLLVAIVLAVAVAIGIALAALA